MYADKKGFKMLGLIKKFSLKKNKENLRDAMEDLLEEIPDNPNSDLKQEHDLFANILNLKDLRATDLMVPRADIIAIPDKKSLQDLAQLMITNGKSRIPVYKDTLDNIIGIAHGRDVLEYMSVEKNIKISEIIDKDVVFISPAMRALDLLKEMQLKRTHLVLVVDEYGGIDGLVTDQDLIEKIVGELEDNHDFDAEPQLILMENGSFDADAKFPLEEIENKIGAFLTEEEKENVDTIGGLAFYLLGRVPLKGEVIVHSSGLKMRINAATPRQVIKLTIYPVSKN